MQNLQDYINDLNTLFIEMQGGCFVNVGTGEIFTSTEVTKFMKLKVEEFNTLNMVDIKKTASENGIEIDQRIINNRSKKRKNSKVKERYEGGDFNIVYRERLGDIMGLKLTLTEKGIYYSLGELLTYPTNTVMINNNLPTFQELGKFIGISDRNLRKYLYDLEEKNLLKLIKVGYKKAIVFNPEYYATGKDLDIDTLKLFNLVKCDENKINEYISCGEYGKI